jgi:hypothetical protein
MTKTGGRRGSNQHQVKVPGTGGVGRGTRPRMAEGLRPEQRHGPEVLARLAGGDDADTPWDVAGAVEPDGAGTHWPWLGVLCVLLPAVAIAIVVVVIL